MSHNLIPFATTVVSGSTLLNTTVFSATAKVPAMAYSDPQSMSFGGDPAIDLDRTSFGTNSGAFTNQDGDISYKLSISHAYGKRIRRVARLDINRIIDDPLLAGVSIPTSMSTYIVIDVPRNGFDADSAVENCGGLISWLGADSAANLAKFARGQV
jgi:hypothetical protein